MKATATPERSKPAEPGGMPPETAEVQARDVEAGAAGGDASQGADAEAAAWLSWPVQRRARVLAGLRHALAADASGLVDALGAVRSRRDQAVSLAAEVLPLAEACGWLGREAARVLGPRRTGARGRPWWLWGTRGVVSREAFGTVLVVGPGNFPLFLPGVQVIQALAAGNRVVVKPAPGCGLVMKRLAAMLYERGVPRGAVEVMGEAVEGLAAVWPRVDLVVLTGSEATGRVVRRECAERGLPCVMELSGCDAVWVLPGADVELAVRCVAFGLMINGSATCIAPRRVLVPGELHDRFVFPLLDRLLSEGEVVDVGAAAEAKARDLVERAIADGARLRTGSVDEVFLGAGRMRAAVLTHLREDSPILHEDVFAPVLTVVSMRDPEAGLALDRRGGFGLGASVFGPTAAAEAWAGRLGVGSVVVNDMIVPTADPRLPFGGRGRSGFGATRGPEGLRAMTRVKAVSVRRGGVRPHLRATDGHTAGLLIELMRVSHARGWAARLRAGWGLLKLSRRQSADQEAKKL
ncbi:MAG: aldehyde dehydrogenase family protein [Planctomycetota bacterium]